MDGDTGVSWPNGMASRMTMMIIWVHRCRREQSWIHELPRPLFFNPSLFSFSLFLIFLCITGQGSMKWEHVVYDISSYNPLKAGQFIPHHKLRRAWLLQWFWGTHRALGTTVMTIIRGRAHARILPMCYIKCPDHILHFIIFFSFVSCLQPDMILNLFSLHQPLGQHFQALLAPYNWTSRLRKGLQG